MGGMLDRIKHAWNAFSSADQAQNRVPHFQYGESFGLRPDRFRLQMSNEKSIVGSIYNRIGLDVSSIPMTHARVDNAGRYLEDLDTGLNWCLKIAGNIDQPGRAFRLDMVMSLLDKGVIAIVPVDTTVNPITTGGYDIKTMRIGEVVSWFPRHVRVSLWNDKIGRREEIVLPKEMVAIVENPLYTVMNEPNSTLQRLIRKLNMLDAIDEQSSSGQLDIIIQLPYVVKSDAKKQAAEQRLSSIDEQLRNSKRGIAYADATEKITQLNRPVENNLLKQVEWLTEMLYGQLGITKEVMNGTADEATMVNYYNRTVEPILGALAEAMKRTFLTKTAITQKQSIVYNRDPFALMPISAVAEVADKMTRNEILSSNEIRGRLGISPSEDPKADELRNKNLPMEQTEPQSSPE